ncbi:MAG: hypothetical protein ACK5OX_19665 [Desertimonas sp.]
MVARLTRRATGACLAFALVAVGGACAGDEQKADTAPPPRTEPSGITAAAATDPSALAITPVDEAAPTSATAAATTTTTPPTSTAGSTSTAVGVTSTVAEGLTTTTTAAVDGVTDELGVLDAVLGVDGTMDLAQALAIIAGSYRPLEGVTPLSTTIVDSGSALRTVVAHLDELPAEQRSGVLTIVDRPGRTAEQVATDTGVIREAGTIVTYSSAVYAARLGADLPDDVAVTLVELPYENPDGTHNFASPAEIATAISWTASTDGSYDECRIRINQDAAVGREFTSAVARETFHCFQFTQRPNGEGVPLWAFEGAAAFAGEEVAEGSGSSTPWWTRWITQPERPLERRTFDAIGFFALIDRSGADAYAMAWAFMSDASPESIRRRLSTTSVFTRWGSQYANEPSWLGQNGEPVYSIAGLDLEGQDPTLATLAPPQQTLALTIDGPGVSAGGVTSSGALSATPYRFPVPPSVIVVTTGAGEYGRLRWPDGNELLLEQGSQAFCLLPTGCECAAAPADQQAAQAVAGTEVFIGVGPFSGDGPAVAAKSLDTWCRQTQIAAPALGTIDRCLVGDWTTGGYRPPALAGVEVQATGGAGGVLRLDEDGTAEIDLEAMEPVVITRRDGPDDITTTTLIYRGRIEGRWGAENGVLVLGEVTAGSFTLHVTVDRAPSGRLIDTVLEAGDPRLAAYATVLGTSQYLCGDGGLAVTSLTPSAGGASSLLFV